MREERIVEIISWKRFRGAGGKGKRARRERGKRERDEQHNVLCFLPLVFDGKVRQSVQEGVQSGKYRRWSLWLHVGLEGPRGRAG